MIGDIAGGKHARDAGRRGIAVEAALDLDVTVTHVQLTGENRSVGSMSDGNEQSRDRDVPARVASNRFEPHAIDAVLISQYLIDGVVPDHGHLSSLHFAEQTVLEDLLRPQLVTAMNQRDMFGDVGQVQRLLDGGIATARHGY